MRRTMGIVILLLPAAGCVSQPCVDCGPSVVSQAAVEPNLLYVPLNGPPGYSLIFENTIATLVESGFEIAEANRYDGRIETAPRIAPGLARYLNSGSPDFYERLLATAQTYRHRASVKIHPADNGGFFVQVVVFKELEDLPRPVRATAGAVFYQRDNNVERLFDVIDPTLFESNWIPRGRDFTYEQVILDRLRSQM